MHHIAIWRHLRKLDGDLGQNYVVVPSLNLAVSYNDGVIGDWTNGSESLFNKAMKNSAAMVIGG